MTIGRHRARNWGRSAVAAVAALGTAAGLIVALGTSAGAVVPGSACEAKGVILASATLANANPALTPCATKNASVVGFTLGTPPSIGLNVLGVTTGVIRSKTKDKIVTHGNREQFNADTNVANVAIGLGALLNVEIDAVRAQAQGSQHLGSGDCFSGGTTYVGNLIINGHSSLIGSAPTTLTLLPGVLVLKLNQQVEGPDGVIETALELDLGGHPLLTLAQAIVGTGCGSDEG